MKLELISKLERIYKWQCHFDEAYSINQENKNGLSYYQRYLIEKPKRLRKLIIKWSIYFIGMILFLVISNFDNGAFTILFIILVIVGIKTRFYSLREIFELKREIPKTKQKMFECQHNVDVSNDMLNNLFGMTDEIANIKEFFPSFPQGILATRYIKYGIEALASGRADTFKEVLLLIDDKIHKEKLEQYAREEARAAQEEANAAWRDRQLWEYAQKSQIEASKKQSEYYDDLKRKRR